jgi:hypothetical protein
MCKVEYKLTIVKITQQLGYNFKPTDKIFSIILTCTADVDHSL